MRILFVSSGLDPRTGGTATAAVSVCLAARRAGLEVDLLYPVERGVEPLIGATVAQLAGAGVTVRAFPFAGSRRAVRWGISPELNAWLFKHAGYYDVIHTHSCWVWTSVAAVRAAKAAGKPVVLMPHESLTRFDINNASSTLLRWAKWLLRDWYVRKADRIIVSSDLEARDSLLADYPRTEIVPHPVFDETDPQPLRRLQGPEPDWSPLTVGVLGRFHPKKNLSLLIDAVAEAPGVRLQIAGGGALEDELRARVARRKIEDRVSFLGFIGGEEKATFLRTIDLLAVPSQFECFGLVATEALVQGTPVLLSPTVGVADDIAAAGAGIIIPPRPDAIATALRDLDQNRERLHAMAGKAFETALGLYSFAAHGARLREVYEDMT